MYTNNADLNNELSIVGIPEDKTACLKEKIKTITTSEENKKRPPLMDFLDIRASISGYPSFRGPKFGINIRAHFLLLFQFVKNCLIVSSVCCDCLFS
jgi:hypothetical protein